MNPILNLAFPEQSDIQFEIMNFPDGHKHIKLLGAFNKYRYLDVMCRICNGDDLFILQQIRDILSIQNMCIYNLNIIYLFTARCDRQFSIGEAVDINIVNQLIQNLGACYTYVLDPHSDRSDFMMNNYALELFNFKKYRLCFPDQGANDRLNGAHQKYSNNETLQLIHKHCANIKPIICAKNRISKDVLETTILVKPRRANKRPVLVVDDLCDGGDTFISLYEKLRELKPLKLSIFVTHAIQKAGIERLTPLYDEVFITNSYKDWSKENLPGNVTVIELE